MQDAIARLIELTPQLADRLDETSIGAATDLLEQLIRPLSREDVLGLMSILPAGGDTAFGLNWTILHSIEAAPSWPIWEALADPTHEWVAIFLIRLKNGGIEAPPV